MKNGIILLSGGIDSAVTFYIAKNSGFNLTALIFNYSQRHKKELKSAKNIARLNNTPCYIEKINLSWVNSSLTNKKIKVPTSFKKKRNTIPLTYVSARNIIFLSYAFSLAENIGAEAVFIGAHTEDYSGYPDCTPGFLNQFQKAANTGMKNKKIKIIAPLIKKTKKEIIKKGLRLHVPFHHTWSCYQGEKDPCLECDSCHFRMNAFAELGLTDPLLGNTKHE